MCENYQELMSSYIDNELSEEEKSDFEKHLASCPSCARELAELREMLETLRELPQLELPTGFHEEFMESLKWRNGGKKKFRPGLNFRQKLNFRPYVNAVAAFIVTFLLLSVFAVTMQDVGRRPQSTGNGYYEVGSAAAQAVPAPAALAPEEITGMPEAAYEESAVAAAPPAAAKFSLDLADEAVNRAVPEQRSIIETRENEGTQNIVIRQSYLELETEDLERAIEYINSLNGDTLNSYSSSDGYSDYYSLTKRIANDEYELFLEKLRGAGEIVSQSSSTNKVNSALSELRLSAGRKEEERERLLELMAGTGDISSLIAIEDRLDVIESELDDFRGRQQRYEVESSTSWLEITVMQKAEHTAAKLTLAERVSQSFISSANTTIALMENALVVFSFMLIPLVIWAALAVAAIFIYKKRKKR